MNKCIICDNTIEKDNEEHIIPYALGNKRFTIKSICRKCNSLLGEKIDNESTNNFMAMLVRQNYGIPGHSGGVPNAFAKGKNEKGEDIRVSKDMKPTIVTRDYSDDKHIHIVTSSAEEAIKIAEKKFKRLGLSSLPEEQKQKIRETKSEKYYPTVYYNVSFDLQKINLELIKIAFETMYYQYGEEILAEESILQLKKILYDYLYLDKYDDELIKGKVGRTKEEFDLHLDDAKAALNETVIHVVQAISENNEIKVFIKVEGMFTGAIKIKVSDSSKYASKLYLICYPSGNIIEN